DWRACRRWLLCVRHWVVAGMHRPPLREAREAAPRAEPRGAASAYSQLPPLPPVIGPVTIIARWLRRTLSARSRPNRAAAVRLIAAAWLTALCLAGCRQGPSAAEASSAETKEKGAPQAEGVTLKPEEIEKAGIKTVTLAASSHTPESTGYAVVITRETIAQAI